MSGRIAARVGLAAISEWIAFPILLGIALAQDGATHAAWSCWGWALGTYAARLFVEFVW